MKKVLLAFLLLFLLPSYVSAAGNFEVEQKDFFFQTSAGKQLTEIVVIRNQTIDPLTLNLSWAGYNLLQHSIDFSSLDRTSITLQPLSTEPIGVSFSVPAEIKSGDYYGSLIVSDGTNSQEIPFTIRVLGGLTEKIIIRNTSYSNNQVSFDVINEGNITTQIAGKVKIDSLFSNVRTEDFDTFKLRSGESKTVKVSQNNLLPGYYRGEVSAKYGTKDYQVNSFFSFWVNLNFYSVSLLTLAIIMSVFLIHRGLKTNA